MADIDRTTLTRELPWPYNGIVRDLTVAVEKGCNYLAALGGTPNRTARMAAAV